MARPALGPLVCGTELAGCRLAAVRLRRVCGRVLGLDARHACGFPHKPRIPAGARHLPPSAEFLRGVREAA